MKPERCEYNPVTGKAAWAPPIPTDCKNEATVSVGGKENWHLCESCAALPRFKRMTRRKPLRKAANHGD